MKFLLELISKIRIKDKFSKLLITYHYMMYCKLKLNLHGNNKLHMYWTYSKKYYLNILTWYVVNKNQIT
jgi:hypothetical protein